MKLCSKKESVDFKKKTRKIAVIKRDADVVSGIRSGIEKRLQIDHGPVFVNEIMDLVDQLIEYSTDLGIDLTRAGFDKRVKINLWRAKEER